MAPKKSAPSNVAPRKRGRPPKGAASGNPLDPKISTGKPRGRPRKIATSSTTPTSVAQAKVTKTTGTTAAKRGRPPKKASAGRAGTAEAKSTAKSSTMKKPTKANAPASNITAASIAGTYAISCPYVLSEWSHYSEDDFELYFCDDGGFLWGHFDVGIFAGSLHMPAAEVKAGCDVKFVWKGSEDETGEEGRGEGSMRFGKAGKSVSIKGVFRGMYGEKLAFEGRKVDDEPTGGRTMALYVIKRAA